MFKITKHWVKLKQKIPPEIITKKNKYKVPQATS